MLAFSHPVITTVGRLAGPGETRPLGLQVELVVHDISRPLGLTVELAFPGGSRFPWMQVDPSGFRLLVFLGGGRPPSMQVKLVVPDVCMFLSWTSAGFQGCRLSCGLGNGVQREQSGTLHS